MRTHTKHSPRCSRGGTNACVAALAATAILAPLGSPVARAQDPVWAFNSGSWTGFTQADTLGSRCAACPWPIFLPKTSTVIWPGWGGYDRAGVCESICKPPCAASCAIIGQGLTAFWVDGIGTDTVKIWWYAWSIGNHNCPDAPPYTAWGIADIILDMGLRVDGTPGDPVTVYYLWDQFSFAWLKHEAFLEDPANVFSTQVQLNGTDLPNPANHFDLPMVRGIRSQQGNGSYPATVGHVANVHVQAQTDAMVNPPGVGSFQDDVANASFEGWIILSLAGPPAPRSAGELEFSLDIGSDTELSDPYHDGDEVFDPGDAYLWHGPPLPVDGTDGVKNDFAIFAQDPWPIPGMVPDHHPAPTCEDPAISPADVVDQYFDLDGHDSVDFSMADLVGPDPLPEPVSGFESQCIAGPEYLVISYDDDTAGHYVGSLPAPGDCEVPTRVQSPGGSTYGQTYEHDEIMGLILFTLTSPAIVGAHYPIEDETTLHTSLWPNPLLDEEEDDDVDSLDVLLYYEDPPDPVCETWLFSPDHEATYIYTPPGLLDPGDIYEVLPGGGFVQAIDDVTHLGLDDDTDIDAFEFVWTVLDWDSAGNEHKVLTLLFSVDDDDPLTPQDESGALDPAMIYASYLTGSFFEFIDHPLRDDVDALTAWRYPIVPPPCFNAGTVTLDRPGYACVDTAYITVEDCDLDVDIGAPDTVDVTIYSDSEPVGEMVTLTETGDSTGRFEGSIDLHVTDSLGVLVVSDGDDVWVEYIDADDGQGHTNVLVEDTAVVVCAAPTITNVTVAVTGPSTATIVFETDREANSAVRYGVDCATLDYSAKQGGYVTSHTIDLSGLDGGTTYYFAVDAENLAGLQTTDDNGGNCYSFDTDPDYFTEEFEVAVGDNDLDYLSILFAPDGSGDYYTACVEQISSLPTDPAGGTQIDLDEDDYELITLSGGAMVSLYGVDYDSFYINSNGNITFTSGDATYYIALDDHFAMPRLSALFDDLSPQNGGSVSWEQFADRVVVTYEDVPEYGATNSNTFQVEMYFDGTIVISYLNVEATDGIAGLSEGNGIPPGFSETDLSALGACAGHPPIAIDRMEGMPMDTSAVIEFQADDDGEPDPPGMLFYTVMSLPGHGGLEDPNTGAPITTVPYALSGGLDVVYYMPGAGFTGDDSFEYKAGDGGMPPEGGDSNIAVVSIRVGCITPGDMDWDDDVDLQDFAKFGVCLQGPGLSIQSICACADIDGDGDVDLKDYAAFQGAFSG
ncbi:MAG: fibronectin type III domain-containing protein [Phycisphaerales bacterium]|nr:MAG: fibronectin type III domain-containing protein [Phycisphaerales bacterium]